MKTKTLTAAGAGFILAEWLIALTIVALTSAVGMRQLSLLLAHRQLVERAYQLREFLFQLRTEALLLHRSWVLEREVSAGEARLVARNPATGAVRRPPFDWRVVHFTEISAGSPGFYGQHQGAMAGHLVLQNRAGQIRVVISARSRIRLCAEQHPVGKLSLCE